MHNNQKYNEKKGKWYYAFPTCSWFICYISSSSESKNLPNHMLKDKFAKLVIQEIETNAKELQWKLDFVRRTLMQ